MNREQSEAHAVNNYVEHLRLMDRVVSADITHVDERGVVHVDVLVAFPLEDIEVNITVE